MMEYQDLLNADGVESLHESGHVAGNNTVTPANVTGKYKWSCQSRPNTEKLHQVFNNTCSFHGI